MYNTAKTIVRTERDWSGNPADVREIHLILHLNRGVTLSYHLSINKENAHNWCRPSGLQKIPIKSTLDWINCCSNSSGSFNRPRQGIPTANSLYYDNWLNKRTSVLPVPDVSHLHVFRLKKKKGVKKHLIWSVTKFQKAVVNFPKILRISSLAGRGKLLNVLHRVKVHAVTRFSNGKIQNSFGVENW